MSRPPGPAVVAVPLGIERLALGRLAGLDVVRVGGGYRRAERAATRLTDRFASGATGAAGVARGLAVVGVCGALRSDLRPGDLVLADEVRDAAGTVRCPGVPLVAAALRAAGLRVCVGPVHTADHLVDGAERAELARTGALVVDTESAPLARAAGTRPVLVLRAVADTPDRPLRSVHTIPGGIAALRALRRAAPVLEQWAAALADPGPVRATESTTAVEDVRFTLPKEVS